MRTDLRDASVSRERDCGSTILAQGLTYELAPVVAARMSSTGSRALHPRGRRRHTVDDVDAVARLRHKVAHVEGDRVPCRAAVAQAQLQVLVALPTMRASTMVTLRARNIGSGCPRQTGRCGRASGSPRLATGAAAGCSRSPAPAQARAPRVRAGFGHQARAHIVHALVLHREPGRRAMAAEALEQVRVRAQRIGDVELVDAAATRAARLRTDLVHHRRRP